MITESQKYVKSVSHPGVTAVRSNTPAQYGDRKHQYLADRRRLYDEQRDYLATDYVKARAQGLNPDDFFEWRETEIRLSDVSTQSVTAFDSKQYDDFKEILFRSRAIDYIPVGAYVETMGSIWMVVNPGNMSSATTNAVIARCRAHWSFYDEYGNIRWEPMVIDRRTMLSNRNESPENLVLMEGYFNIKCQKNANTVRLRDNQRMILGSYAYHITGYTDFFEEFTGDDDSAHVINLTVRREEPEEHDDLVNHIADGLLYVWSASVSGPGSVPVGGEATLAAHMLKNGEEVPESGESPQTWRWSSSDETVLTAAPDGTVAGVSAGSAVVTAVLDENPDLTAEFAVTVSDGGEEMRFVGVVPEYIVQYTTAVLEAEYIADGVPVEGSITWEFAGAERENWTAVIDSDGKRCTISCDSASAEPLLVTIRCGGAYKTVSIKLLGY